VREAAKEEEVENTFKDSPRTPKYLREKKRQIDLLNKRNGYALGDTAKGKSSKAINFLFDKNLHNNGIYVDQS